MDLARLPSYASLESTQASVVEFECELGFGRLVALSVLAALGFGSEVRFACLGDGYVAGTLAGSCMLRTARRWALMFADSCMRPASRL